MKWFRNLLGIHDRPGSGRAGGCTEVVAWVKGRTMGLSAGRIVFIPSYNEGCRAMANRLIDAGGRLIGEELR
jgi:hypothetical protein